MEGKEQEGERGEEKEGEEKKNRPTFSSFKSVGKFICFKSSYLQHLFLPRWWRGLQSEAGFSPGDNTIAGSINGPGGGVEGGDGCKLRAPDASCCPFPIHPHPRAAFVQPQAPVAQDRGLGCPASAGGSSPLLPGPQAWLGPSP